MALVKVQKEEIAEKVFRIDPALLETPAAKQATLVGLLRAKLQAMHQAELLLKVGRPLLVAVVFVSFLHDPPGVRGAAPTTRMALPPGGGALDPSD
jgi:hypothetical protein